MATKKTNIQVPKYDVEHLLRYLESLSQTFQFDSKMLTTFILADWIKSFQLSCSQGKPPVEVFLDFIRSAMPTAKFLKEYEYYAKQQSKQNNNDSNDKQRCIASL